MTRTFGAPGPFHLSPLTPLLILLLYLAKQCLANVEKVIFLGPEPVKVPSGPSSFSNLRLNVLSPINSSLAKFLEVRFPSEDGPNGKATWLLLSNLSEGQRYEVRICWAATQPTTFDLQTYPLPFVLSTPELTKSLYESSTSSFHLPPPPNPSPSEREISLLLLRVLGTADYVAADSRLMRDENVPPVRVDLILDPFVLNVLPRSLVPTVGWVLVVAGVTWVMALWVVREWLPEVLAENDRNQRKKRK